MDEFVRQTAKMIGPGGHKCNCCNPFRVQHHGESRKRQGLNGVRRARLQERDRRDRALELSSIYVEELQAEIKRKQERDWLCIP